jgi:hypothetical protein
MLCCSALGAFVHWLALKYGRGAQQSLDQLSDDILGEFRVRVLLNLLLFVALGSILSMILVSPQTMRQAVAGGMAWTTLVSGVTGRGTKGN